MNDSIDNMNDDEQENLNIEDLVEIDKNSWEEEKILKLSMSHYLGKPESKLLIKKEKVDNPVGLFDLIFDFNFLFNMVTQTNRYFHTTNTNSL